MQRGGAKSSVDDLAFGRGVVLSRAATTLRSIETPPLDRRFVRARRACISGIERKRRPKDRRMNDCEQQQKRPAQIICKEGPACHVSDRENLAAAAKRQVHAGSALGIDSNGRPRRCPPGEVD